MAKIARVLVGLHLEGNVYHPDQVLELDDKLAKALEKEGYIDSNTAAVEDSMSRLGMKIVKHARTEEEAQRIATDGAALAAQKDAAEAGKGDQPAA